MYYISLIVTYSDYLGEVSLGLDQWFGGNVRALDRIPVSFDDPANKVTPIPTCLGPCPLMAVIAHLVPGQISQIQKQSIRRRFDQDRFRLTPTTGDIDYR